MAISVSCSISPFNPPLLLPSRSKSPLLKPSSLSLKQSLHTPLRAFQSENPKPTNPDETLESPSSDSPDPEPNSSTEVAAELKQMLIRFLLEKGFRISSEDVFVYL